MKLLRFPLLAALSVLLVVAVAACGDDEEDSDDGGTEPTAAATDDSGGGGGGSEVSVEAFDFGFDPEEATVAAGEVTVTLVNAGEAPHTLTVYVDEDFSEAVEGANTQNVTGGEEGEFTATFEAGDYHFRCEIHPAMQGTLTAE